MNAIGIVTIIKIRITIRYLSTSEIVYKTIYLFDFRSDYRKNMAKMLELLGLVLVAIMTLGFVGVFQPAIESGLSPLFWACAGGTLAIILYRKRKQKKQEQEN